MRGGDDLRGSPRILNLRQGHVELNSNREPAILRGQELDTGVDRNVADLDVLPTADDPERALEACRVTNSEELLRVRAIALTTHLLRRAQLHVQHPISCSSGTLRASTGDCCFCRVKNSRHGWLRFLEVRRAFHREFEVTPPAILARSHCDAALPRWCRSRLGSLCSRAEHDPSDRLA